MTIASAFLTSAFCLLPFALTMGGAQQVSPQVPPKFTAGVDIVELDVTVLDKTHKPVRGLKADAFIVSEDGKPRSIVAFSSVDVPPPIQPAAQWMKDVTPDVESNDLADHRLFVIIVDDALNANSAPGVPRIGRSMPSAASSVTGVPWQVQQTKLAATKAVEGLGPGDEAAIIFTGAAWDGQGFTTDHRKLLNAIDKMRLTPPAGSPCAPLWGSTDALQAAAEALAAIPHRKKVVLYISVGPPVNLVGKIDDPICEPHAQDSAQAALRAAQLGNVTFYGIDPKGLTGASVMDKRLGFLDDFSSNTGGRMIARTNDIVSHIPEILAESMSYYLLGYELAGQEHDGRFHRLEVKVPDHPDWEIQARKTRFDSKLPARSQDALTLPPSTMQLAISGYVPSTALRVEATTAPFAMAGDKSLVEVAVNVGLPAESRAAGRDEADLLIRAFTVDGQLIDSVHENTPVAVAGAQFDLASKIDLKPGRYTLRIAVQSKAAGKTGSVYTDVVVPDFTKDAVSLSGVVMTASSGSSLRGDALAALTPTTTRVFEVSDRMQAFMRVYQGGAGAVSPVSLKIRILDEHSTAVVDRTETLPAPAFARDRQADYSFRLPLSTLNAGEYWLSFEVTVGKRTARRDVRFTVK